MQVSDNGLKLITKWEVPIPYLYDDGGSKGLGNATVAIGILVHFGPYHEQRGICRDCDEWPRKSEPSQWLTRAQMDALLIDKANATGRFKGGQNYVGAVNKAFPSGINQNQFDAMCSYSYNYGSGSPPRMAAVFYGGGNMERAFTNPQYLKPEWAAVGLLRRRKDEYALWSSNAAPGLPVEEDEMWHAWNEAASNDFWKDGAHMFVPGQRYKLQLAADLPKTWAKGPSAIDLDLYGARGSGMLGVYQGGGILVAGRVTQAQGFATVRVAPTPGGEIEVEAVGGSVTVSLGVLGYLD